MATLNQIPYQKNKAIRRFSRPYRFVIPTRNVGLVTAPVGEVKGAFGKPRKFF